MFTTRTIVSASLLARAAKARLRRPADLPSPVSTAALFEDDCLVTQLICGDITGAQYRAAMAELAAREDRR